MNSDSVTIGNVKDSLGMKVFKMKIRGSLTMTPNPSVWIRLKCMHGGSLVFQLLEPLQARLSLPEIQCFEEEMHFQASMHQNEMTHLRSIEPARVHAKGNVL